MVFIRGVAMQYKISLSTSKPAFPYQVVIEVSLVSEGMMLGNKEERYRRVVPYSDDVGLLEAVRQALNGRVLGGLWDLVEGDE